MARADVRPEALYAQVKLQDADPARTSISRGTKSSNPLPSTGESDANLTFNFPSKLLTGGPHRPVLDLNGSEGWLTDDSPLRDG
jgi:hypothetical protein